MAAEGDRRVHARYRDMEIVRYSRAGKWYLEPTIPNLKRQQVKIDQAVINAIFGLDYEGACGQVFYGLPGGEAFDRKVRKVLAERDARNA